MTGAFAKYEGAIYQTFDERIHLQQHVEWSECKAFRRAVDWGASVDHPFVCLWAAQDGQGQWRIFDEYRSTAQVSAIHHVMEIIRGTPGRSLTPATARPGRTPRDRTTSNCLPNTASKSMPANNSVYLGIESVRAALKVNPGTGEPGLIIDEENCPNLARKWRLTAG